MGLNDTMKKLNNRTILLCLMLGIVGALLGLIKSIFDLNNIEFICVVIVAFIPLIILTRHLTKKNYFDTEDHTKP